MLSGRGKLVWILSAAAALLLLVAVVAGVLYLVLRQRERASAGWENPLAAIAPAEVAPDLALYPLAGASELETIDAALSSGELETAYATLVFSVDLSDAQRVGRLTLLGSRFVLNERPDRAATCYQQVYDIAVLSPSLNDPVRADALLASGKGWAAAGDTAQALNAYDQVYLLATRSPYMQVAHRREFLSALEEGYRTLAGAEQAEACRQRISELDQGTTLQPALQPAVTADLLVEPEGVSSAELGALEETRRQKAYAVMTSEVWAEAQDPPSALISDLAQALRAEDAAKLQFYQGELQATTQPGNRIRVEWQLIRWLTLKYRVAVRGWGMSIVPEWEPLAAEIQASLSKSYEDLLFDYEDLVAGMPTADLVGPGSYEVRRELALAGRLGQYPNFPEQQMVEKLQSAVGALVAAGSGDQLFVNAELVAPAARWFLSPGDLYTVP